ncbi:hypothetical protein BASA50_007858 [Batrachochytrium salamandrivorans]|uniref:Extracellular metalloproteinase n=1 Tax=Batrachochytrium salamandrivorans TaxID=1357716 RepID=A0ABQ8F8U8_9FUNG|nr:hypothetical protein BASA50_007858 [Batrachochytrium salamandrivorans]
MFVPALTLILASVSSAVIAVPTVNNVYERAVASLDPSSTELPFYFPESVYESIPHSGAAPSPSSEEDDAKTATDYISKRLNLGENDFKVVDSYTDSAGISHVYGTHMVNGASISNHQAAAHVKNGEVTFFSTSFGTDQHLAKRDLAVSAPKATLSFEEVSVIASTKLDIPVYSEFEHALEYVAQPDGKVVYTYKFQLRDNPVTKWVQVWCDATTGEVVQVINFANEASYKVVQIPHRDPTEGFSVVANPEFRDSSPNGWSDGKATEGNNAIALTPSGRITPATSDGVFNAKFNSKEEPGTVANVAAAAVNLFYVSNMMHDISYQYGFTESAGNFQKDNFGKGGQGNDAVTINVLNPSYTNNANFITPPDGQPGVMNMFRFTKTTPNRNPGFDNAIVIHEYAHGISHRLTGGPANNRCISHSRGSEVWASLLWEVYWNLVAKHGFSANLYDASQSAGNVVAMKIIMGGLTLQSCNPTLLGARDAIITADVNHYKGAHKCEIYKGFAKRGLGLGATDTRTNDFSVPSECQ